MKNLLIERIKSEVCEYYNNGYNYLDDGAGLDGMTDGDEYEFVGDSEAGELNREFGGLDYVINEAVRKAIKIITKN